MRKSFYITGTLSLFFALFFYFFSNSKPRPDLSVVGYAKMADGLGRQSVDLMNALYDEVSVGFIPFKGSDLTQVPERIQGLIKHPNKKLGKVIIYEASLPCRKRKHFDRIFKGPKNLDQIRIAYSMIESSRIPQPWVEILNEMFDAVAVPDPFLLDVYADSGVKIPVFMVPLGLDLSSFLQQPLKKEANRPFCFVNVSSLIPRKNCEGLIQAFCKVFANHPDVELHLNYRTSTSSTKDSIENLLASLNVKNVYLTGKKLDHASYLAFLKNGDALVSLSKGEGFSIQPREAMALGLPVIISDNTAHSTIVKSGLACGIACPTTEKSHNYFLRCECGEEYISDLDQAALAMKDLYENYDCLLQSADERRRWAAQYQYENLKPLYLNLVKPKHLTLGDRNEVTFEGLTTNSRELFEKYCRLIDSCLYEPQGNPS